MYFCFTMKVAQKIEKKINKLKEGTTFKYQQLSIESNEYSAAAKAIERLIEKGIIKRVSTGVFYKPKQSIFGELKPNEEELLKPYLFQNNKRIAYITGISLYNRMGLTTQVPRKIKIASRDKRITVSVGNIKGNPVKSYVDVTDKNYTLLEILDTLKDFKKIPDLDKKSGIKIISTQLNKLNTKDIKQLIDCALSYPPRVRAFLGSLLEQIEFSIELKTLKKSLNPLSEYNYGIDEKTLPTITNWNIK
jgi:predicted transcriptional regulator of viral defense system